MKMKKIFAPLCVGNLDLSSIFSSEALNVNSTSRGRVSLFKLLCCSRIHARVIKILGRVVEGRGLKKKKRGESLPSSDAFYS